MRAGVLTHAEIVPIPGRAALVIARYLLDPERRALSELRRQRDGGEVLRQGLGQIDHAHGTCRHRARQGEEIERHGHASWPAISRSSALGLTASRWRMSSATSPTNASSRPRLRAAMTAPASAPGASLGGGTVWNHSVSSGPKNTFTTLTPPGRSSVRTHWAAERQAAS